jgi:hypothetical protein
MGKILSEAASKKIAHLHKQFAPFAKKGWMCEGGEYEGKPCNNIFNNNTGEFIYGSYDGEILLTTLSHTPVTDAKKMAQLQGAIMRTANND